MPKPANSRKPRKTPAKQINEFALAGDIGRAHQVASFGNLLSVTEGIFHDYYIALYTQEVVVKVLAAKPIGNFDPVALKADVLAKVEHHKKIICDLFIEAVNDHDGKKILEIAKAVWFFKPMTTELRQKGNFNKQDRERTMLLYLKEVSRLKGSKMTIRQVAEFIANGNRPDVSEDGFSALRRKCKAIGLKLAPNKKNKAKKKP